jgi:hypothetical protein
VAALNLAKKRKTGINFQSDDETWLAEEKPMIRAADFDKSP